MYRPYRPSPLILMLSKDAPDQGGGDGDGGAMIVRLPDWGG